MLHMLEKLHHLVGSPILHIFCKLLISWKYVQLHCTWCHCSYLSYHPWWVSSVLKPKCLPCLVMFEIWVPFIRLQPETRSSRSAMQFPHPGINGIIRTEIATHTDLFHPSAYCITLNVSFSAIPRGQREKLWQEFFRILRNGGITDQKM